MKTRPQTRGCAALQRWARADQSRTQTWIATQIGVTQASVSDWLAGKKRPMAAQREALRMLAGIPIEHWDTADERRKQRKLARRLGASEATAPAT